MVRRTRLHIGKHAMTDGNRRDRIDPSREIAEHMAYQVLTVHIGGVLQQTLV